MTTGVSSALLVLSAAGAHAQHVRRTDDITQAALIQSGLSQETTCRGEVASSRPRSPSSTGLTALPSLDSTTPPPLSLAGSVEGVVDGRSGPTPPRIWIGWGAAQLRAHGRHTGCHFDWRARTLAATRSRVGADAVVTASAPGALGGALHLFAEAGAASDQSAVEELDTPRHAEIGAAYTTPDLLRPFYPLAALDLRARLSAGASFGYGEMQRLRNRTAVPDLGATVVGKIEEVLHGGFLYAARLVPDYVIDARLLEQSATLMYGLRGNGPSGGLLARSPYLTARYSSRRIGNLRSDREVALSAGLTLF